MRCEKGDLAKITMSIRPSNIGKTVLVDSYIGRYEQGETFEFRGITCKAIITDHYWWVSSEYGLTNMLGETPKVYCPDSWLEPLRPTKVTQREDVDIDITA